jgi:uncharacterized damage-inducible protein DinB
MTLSQLLVPELEQELASTRTCLERLADDKFSFQPHGKSMSATRLASHLAEIPSWVAMTLNTAELDLSPPGGPAYQPTVFDSSAALLACFDKNSAEAVAALASASDAALAESWRMLYGGHEIIKMPKGAVIRTWVLNHLIHHRGQFSVYLRLLEVPVPSIYGPSADEGNM